MHYTLKQNKIKPLANYIPVNFDLNIFAKADRDYAAYFLNLLHWKYCTWQADKKGWINLKQDYILKIIPREVWPAIRDRLIGRNVIFCRSSWMPGVKSRSYKIAPKYRKTKRIECTNEALARRIHKLYASETIALPVHRWLAEKFEQLKFDMPQAEKIIQTLTPDDETKISTDAYRWMIIEGCHRIINEDYYPACDLYGRFHTPLTNLPRELRYCLSVNGKKLVNLDLANSQPLIAGIVAREFYKNGKKAARLRNRNFDPQGNPYHKRHPEFSEPSDRPDLEKYIQTCEKGTIYESLMSPGDDRDRIKIKCLIAMYDTNQRNNNLLAGYPSVDTMLRSLKKKDYRHAARLMQNVEATIFLHTICERIRQEEPTLPIFTIHDSILTVPEGVNYVKNTIQEVFRQIGVSPLIKREEY